MGVIGDRTGLQIGISRKTNLVGNQEDISVTEKFGGFTTRSKYSFGKRRYRNSAKRPISHRFLQHIFSGSQEKRENETSNKFETLEQVSPEKNTSKWTH